MSDIRFAIRQLARSGGFTAIAVLTLAIGIGLSTSMFSFLNWLALRPLPYPDRDELVRVYRTTPQSQTASFCAADFLDLKREATDGIDLAAFVLWGFTLTEPDRSPVNLNAVRVSSDFMRVLGLQPHLGRMFNADEDQPGNHVVILSHATWLAQFGGDPNIVNRTISIDGEATTVVGVMPEEFSSLFLFGPGDVFRPLALTETEKADREGDNLGIIGRRDANVPLEQVNARLATVNARMAELRRREQSADGIRAISLQDAASPPQGGLIGGMLVATAGFVLMIVCGNLANLQLARALARAKEYAVRAALGASRWQLIRPLLVESTLLALLGGWFGVLVAYWANEALAKGFTADLPISFDLALDWRVISFAIAVSLLTGAMFGIMPAWLISRVRVNETLKGGSRGTTGDRSQHRFRHSLTILQFAAALVLLACAGYFIRGLDWMLARDPGWDTAHITQGVISPPQARYTTPEQTYGFYRQLDERLSALPGVEDVAVAWTTPLFQFLNTRSYVIEGREPPQAGHEPLAFVNGVTPSFLNTLGIKLVSGRDFSETDKLGAPRVVMINESMARALFPEESPIGKRLGGTDPEKRDWAEIVGVFSDVSMAGNPSPQPTAFQVFCPLSQDTWNYVTVAIRSQRPSSMVEPLRRALADLDPTIPLQMPGTAEDLVQLGARGMRMITTILGSFGVLGLFLASLGLYGVVARLVTQRTPEIGIRLALGAQLQHVMRMILVSGLRLALIGAAIGLGLAILIGFGLNAVFRDVNAESTGVDYLTLGVATGLLTLIALVASWLPARRATRVNPLEALRAE